MEYLFGGVMAVVLGFSAWAIGIWDRVRVTTPPEDEDAPRACEVVEGISSLLGVPLVPVPYTGPTQGDHKDWPDLGEDWEDEHVEPLPPL